VYPDVTLLLLHFQLCDGCACIMYHVLLMTGARVTTIVKTYGAHLKASAATVRLRLYNVLALLPPETYEGIWDSVSITLLSYFR